MKSATAPARARVLIALIAGAGLAASGCGGDAEDTSTLDAAAEAPAATTDRVTEPAATTTAAIPSAIRESDTDTDTETPGPGTDAIEDGPAGQAAGTDRPDDSQAGGGTAAPVSLEPRLAFISNMDNDSEIVAWNVDGSGGRAADRQLR